MDNSTAEQSGTDASTPDQKLESSPKTSLRNALCLGIVGAVAAVIASVAIQQTGEVFQLPDHLLELTVGRIPGPEDQQRIGVGIAELNSKHAALWMAIAGSIVGLLFGLTLGVIRGSRNSLIAGALGGLLIGGMLSTCGGLAGNYLGQTVVSNVRVAKLHVPEQYSMLLHGMTWLVAGLGIGLGTGMGAMKNRIGCAIRSMLMGGIGGAAGGALYPFVASVAMPFVDPSMTIPKGDLNRILWIGLPCVLIGLVLGRKA